MKQKGKQNWRVWRRVVAWLLTLVMVIGLTNGLTLPAQAAGSDSFEVTLNPTTGALDTIEYTIGSNSIVSPATGTLTTYLILWDADNKNQGVLKSNSVTNPAENSTIVLQCSSNTVFGKRYRIARYSVSSVPIENTLTVPVDWPALPSVSSIYEADSFDTDCSVALKTGGASTYQYTGRIIDALMPHDFNYVASDKTVIYNGTVQNFDKVNVSDFPFLPTSSTVPDPIFYKDSDGQYTLTTAPGYQSAGEYVVDFQISCPELGYRTVTGTKSFTIEPISTAINFATPGDRTIVLPPEDASTLTIDNPARAADWLSGETESISYSSSDTSVAEVDNNGKVTVLAAGETTITATVTPQGNYSYASPTVSYKITVSKTPITVEFTKSEINAFVGVGVEANPLILKKNGTVITGTDWTVTYSSSDETIATVGTDGTVTALSEGEATITATIVDGPNYDHEPETVSYHLTVSKIPINVKFSDGTNDIDAKSILVEDTIEDVKVYYQNNDDGTWATVFLGDGSVAFSSSDEAVATVDSNGKVTGIGEGEAVITATFTDTNQCRYIPNAISYSVNVQKFPISVRLTDDTTKTIFIDDTIENVTVQYWNDASGWVDTRLGDGSVAFSSSDETVATVDENGKVTGVGAGEATITATFTEGNRCKYIPNTLSYDVIVNKIPWGIYYEPTEINKFRDETVDAKLKYYDYRTGTISSTLAPAGDGTFSFTSSDETVATVDENGNVTITGVGTTVITATVADGDKYTYVNKNTASFTLNVSKREGVIVWDPTFSDPEPYTVTKTFGNGSFTEHVAKKQSVANDGLNGGDGIISYYSSDPKVATINASTGEVTIVGAGTTVIYATVTDTDVFTYASCGNRIQYTLIVEKGTLAVGTDYTAPTAKTVDYNGSAQELVTPGTVTGNKNHKFYYALAGTASAPAPTSGWSTAVPKAKDAGTYYVWWKIVAESNYNDVSETGPLTSTINQKNVEAVDSNVTVSLTNAGPFTYDGTSKAPSVLVKDGQKTVNAGSYSVTYRLKSGDTWGTAVLSADDVVAAGTYKAVVEFSGNYTGSCESAEFEIVKANAEANPAPKAKTGLVYTGLLQQLIDAGTPPTGTTIEYAYTTESNADPATLAFTDNAEAIKDQSAGTYYVWWKIVGNDNYNGTEPRYLTVTIAPADTYVTPTDDGGYTYNGSAVSPEPSTNYKVYRKSDDALLTEGTHYEVVYNKKNGNSWEAVAEVKDAGEYRIYFDMNSNYKNPPYVTFTVKKADPSLTAPTENSPLTYNGAAQALVSAGNAPGAGDGNKMLYAVNKSTTTAPTSWSENIPKATDAGTYQVWYKCTGNENYNEMVCAAPVAVTIAPKVATDLTAEAVPATFVYNGQAQVPTSYTVKDVDKTVGAGAYSVTSYKKDSAVVDASDVQAVGSYTAVLTFTGNYTGTKEVPFSITKTPVVVNVKPAAIENLVYNGFDQALVTAGKCSDNGSMQYAVTDSAEPVPGTWSGEIPKKTDAGKYYVWYKGKAPDNNHSDSAPAYVIAEIAPKNAFGDAKITAEANPDSFEYDGNAKNPSILVKDNGTVIDAANYEISYQMISGSMWVTVASADVKSVGTYKAVVALKGNYTGQREVIFVIEKATAELSTVPVPATRTYNGEAQELLSTPGATSHGTLKYAIGENGTTAPTVGWSEAVPTAVDAGEYYIWYRIVGDQNHKDLPATLLTNPATINKAAGTCTVEASPDTFMYDGTPKTPVISSVKVGDKELAESEYTVSYKKSSDNTNIAEENVKEIGSYQLIVTPTNYSGVGKKDFSITAVVPRIAGHSLVLTGSIGVNFYMELPDAPGFVYSRMEFAVDGTTQTAYLDRNARSAEGYYRFTCYVNAIQMAKEITATFYYSENGTVNPLSVGTYSVKKYIEEANVLQFSAKTTALINAIKEYGYYAEKLLNSGTAEMPQGTLTEADIAKAKAAVASRSISVKRSSKIEAVSMSLLLDSDTTLRIYFKPVSSYTGSASATVDGKSVTPGRETADEKRFYVDIPGIAANRLGTNYTVKLKTGSVTTTVTASVLSYIKMILDTTDDTNANARYAMTALYNYYAAAVAYKS